MNYVCIIRFFQIWNWEYFWEFINRLICGLNSLPCFSLSYYVLYTGRLWQIHYTMQWMYRCCNISFILSSSLGYYLCSFFNARLRRLSPISILFKFVFTEVQSSNFPVLFYCKQVMLLMVWCCRRFMNLSTFYFYLFLANIYTPIYWFTEIYLNIGKVNLSFN